jgi:hypothetical protein
MTPPFHLGELLLVLALFFSGDAEGLLLIVTNIVQRIIEQAEVVFATSRPGFEIDTEVSSIIDPRVVSPSEFVKRYDVHAQVGSMSPSITHPATSTGVEKHGCWDGLAVNCGRGLKNGPHKAESHRVDRKHSSQLQIE